MEHNSGWPTRSCPPTPFGTQAQRSLGILLTRGKSLVGASTSEKLHSHLLCAGCMESPDDMHNQLNLVFPKLFANLVWLS